jgi:hypothetical protein
VSITLPDRGDAPRTIQIDITHLEPTELVALRTVLLSAAYGTDHAGKELEFLVQADDAVAEIDAMLRELGFAPEARP